MKKRKLAAVGSALCICCAALAADTLVDLNINANGGPFDLRVQAAGTTASVTDEAAEMETEFDAAAAVRELARNELSQPQAAEVLREEARELFKDISTSNVPDAVSCAAGYAEKYSSSDRSAPFDMAIWFDGGYSFLTKDMTAQWRTETPIGQYIWNEAGMTEFLEGLAAVYNKEGPLDFMTHDDRVITLYSVFKGRMLDIPGTVEEIKRKAMEGTYFADPVWNIPDEEYINGIYRPLDYVEVDIKAQHVYFYKDGEMIFDTDCVSGTANSNRESDPGIFQIKMKRSPSVLRGLNEDGTPYESHVTYWMPYNGGEGLHDASWRGTFGGSIYQHSGSHGCINLPIPSAKFIYEHVSVGTPVIVYNK